MFTLILFFAAMIANGKTVETIEFVDIDGRESRSYLFIPDGCTAETPCPGWQVNPDWTGLDEYELTRACMIADWGYVAYVPDVYGIDVDSYDHIGTPVYEHLHRVEPGPYNGLLHHVAVDRTSYMQKIRNGYEFLSSRPEVISDKLVTNGYCFGGVAVMDALHQDVPFLAGFGNHPNIFTFDTGVQEGNAPDGRVVSLSGALDFADTYNFDPALTTGNTNGAISWWNSLERESARWQQVRYSGIGHFFTNFDYAVDPNPDHPEDVNHYDATADLRSWGLQKFHAMTMFGEITQEPMESSGDACSDPIYHCGAIQIPHGAEGSTMRGMEYYPTACNAESLCPAVIVIPDEDSHDFTMAKNEQIVREGYITISADVSTDADLSDEAGKQMYISKIESVVSHLQEMNMWDGKVVAVGYGLGASGLMDYVMGDTTSLNGMVLFGGDYTMRSGDFPESAAETKIIIHHGYKDQFEENDFPGLESSLEAVGASYEIDFYGSHIGACFYDPQIQVCSKTAEETSSGRYMCYDADADHYSWGQTKLFFNEIFEDLVPVAGPDEPCPEVSTLISPAHRAPLVAKSSESEFARMKRENKRLKQANEALRKALKTLKN